MGDIEMTYADPAVTLYGSTSLTIIRGMRGSPEIELSESYFKLAVKRIEATNAPLGGSTSLTTGERTE